LKDFLNRFRALVVKMHTKDEDMMVHTFRRGVLPGPFSYSLIRCRPKTLNEIRRRVVNHIGAKEEVTEKRGSIGPARPRGTSHPQPMRVHEATTEKKAPGKQSPYETRKPLTRERTKEGAPTRHNFRMDLKELIVIPNVADRLKLPPKTDRRLGPNKDTWAQQRHLVRIPPSLWSQPAQLPGVGIPVRQTGKNGFLKEYL